MKVLGQAPVVGSSQVGIPRTSHRLHFSPRGNGTLIPSVAQAEIPSNQPRSLLFSLTSHIKPLVSSVVSSLKCIQHLTTHHLLCSQPRPTYLHPSARLTLELPNSPTCGCPCPLQTLFPVHPEMVWEGKDRFQACSKPSIGFSLVLEPQFLTWAPEAFVTPPSTAPVSPSPTLPQASLFFEDPDSFLSQGLSYAFF